MKPRTRALWSGRIIGPMLVAGSHGSPTTIWSKAEAPASRNSSYFASWTSSRASAAQPWPPLRDQRRCISTAIFCDVDVGHHEAGRLAAELEGDPYEVLRRPAP